MGRDFIVNPREHDPQGDGERIIRRANNMTLKPKHDVAEQRTAIDRPWRGLYDPETKGAGFIPARLDLVVDGLRRDAEFLLGSLA